MIEETYPSGRKVMNTLDRDGELALVQSRKNANFGFVNYASAFKYNSSGAVEKIRLGNGHWETAQYNNRLQVTQIGLGTTDADQNLLKLELGYGDNTQNNGSLRSQKISFSGLSQAFEQTYTYDDLNRIQVAEEMVGGASNWKQTFQYDRFGNRRFDAANTTTLGSCTQAQCNPLINTSDNRFSGGQGYGYDQDGNVTQDAAGQRFGYDAENHQKEFFAANNPGGTPDATYQYDGDGRRVKKISSLETTIFVYNAGGTLVAEYSIALSQTQQVSYLTTDHLGSPRVITNENGAVTTRQDFSAFGDETLTVQRTQGLGYKPDSIRQDYTGYQKDDESGGLEFAQARYYNTKHGRFTSVDPLTASANAKDPQTLNRYSYVLNSPYKFTDPLGLISETTGACGGRCSNSGPGGGGMVSTYGDAFQEITGAAFGDRYLEMRNLRQLLPAIGTSEKHQKTDDWPKGFTETQENLIAEQLRFMANPDCEKAFQDAGVTTPTEQVKNGITIISEDFLGSAYNDLQWAPDKGFAKQMRKARNEASDTNDITQVGPWGGRRYIALTGRAFNETDDSFSVSFTHAFVHSGGKPGSMAALWTETGKNISVKTGKELPGFPPPTVTILPRHDLEWMGADYNRIVKACTPEGKSRIGLARTRN